MLAQLTINQFAIVHHLDIEFAQGMSVITGETGAGKSIAIDALGLCLGQRTDIGMLREGEERADICATFHIEPTNPAYQWLAQHELQDPDFPENCILRRIINHDGRSKAFINSIPVSATQLKDLGQYLVQVNGQHSSQFLLKNDYQLQLLDSVFAHTSLLAQMQQSYRTWKLLHQQVKTFSNNALKIRRKSNCYNTKWKNWMNLTSNRMNILYWKKIISDYPPAKNCFQLHKLPCNYSAKMTTLVSIICCIKPTNILMNCAISIRVIPISKNATRSLNSSTRSGL